MKKNYYEKVPRNEVLCIGHDQLKAAADSVVTDWHTYLENKNIKLPPEKTYKWYQLAILKHFQGKAVHKSDISALIAQLTDKSASDQQVRHLKTQDGWYLLNRGDAHNENGKTIYNPDGCHVLITTEKPHPNTIMARRAAVNRGDWNDILKEYDNKCASCGTSIGEYHRFDSSLKVEVLEQGHMDPNEPLAVGNIIPMCRWCNKVARGDFVFDLQGRPRAVASIRPVTRANSLVIEKIKKWLLNK